MEILDLKQGSDLWHATRLQSRTASEAPAMAADSKHQKRDDLLKLKKTGIAPEVSRFQQKIYDDGHAMEAGARPIVEAILGFELYPVTGRTIIDDLPLLASMDGLTMLGDIVFEHKMWNKDLPSIVKNDPANLDEHYKIQLDQQLLVTGAEKAIFVVSDGTEDNLEWMWYFPDADRFDKLIAGWKQFQKDLDAFEVAEIVDPVKAEVVENLPTLSISVKGGISASNLEAYEKTAIQFIGNIKTDLQTDQDFADADSMVKFCKKAEGDLKAAKQHAIGQMADIDALFNTIDRISEEMKQTRLNLDKKVKNKKDEIKIKIVSAGELELIQYFDALNDELKIVALSGIFASFPMAIKGKRNIESIQSAVNDEVARVKIEMDAAAKMMRANLKTVEDSGDYASFLFSDLQQIVGKAPDDFALLVGSRIMEYEKQETERKEREANQRAEEVAEPVAEEKEPEPQARPAHPLRNAEATAISVSPAMVPELQEWCDKYQMSVTQRSELAKIFNLYGKDGAA